MNNQITAISPGTILHGRVYDYSIVRVLGQGAFGITYLALTRMVGPLGEIDVQVTVKEFFAKEFNTRMSDGTVTATSQGTMAHQYGKAFQRESENLARMKHPHIVRVLEAFEANGTYYYSMEYITGGSLDAKVIGTGIPESEALPIIRKVGNAISYMHDHKMMHLDLKPKNIMLKSDGSPVVIDFGLSKQFDSDGEPESSSSIGQGTPGYAPLEQANQTSGSLFQPTLDIYALGATLYKMLTGTTVPSASDILNEGFPEDELRRKSITTKTIEAIKCAMAPMRKNRPQTVDAFLSLIGEKNNASISFEDKETIGAPVGKSQMTKGDETVVCQNKDLQNPNPERNASKEILSKDIPALWIGLCMFLMAVLIGYCIYEYISEPIIENLILWPLSAVGGIVIEIGFVLLFFRRKPGFWFVLVGGTVVAILFAMRSSNFIAYKNWEEFLFQSFVYLIVVYFACAISYLVFQIKNKDGLTAWQMLRPGLFNKRY